MYGREWDLLPEVFAPIYSPSTNMAMEFLGLANSLGVPRAGSLLEIGCGTGMVAVSAALAGCERVVAADVNPSAVRNAAMNATRHGVSDRFDARHSDLFTQLDEHERFDTIFWSSNYVLAPPEYQYQNMHERAYVDPGYRTHRRFLEEAPRWLAPHGVVLLHFSTRGDLVSLLRIAGECGRGLHMLRSNTIREGELDIEHMLLEVTMVAARDAAPATHRAGAPASLNGAI
jgi:release factor glutamine methyltransferase